PGGDHAHVHAELADFPAVLLHVHSHESAESVHPHAHHHPSPHTHPGISPSSDLHHIHHHHSIRKKNNHRSEFAYHNPLSSHRGHWHSLNVFQHATPSCLVPLLPALSCLPVYVALQTFPFVSALPVSQPRAPPIVV